MNYTNEILYCSIACGAAWECANLVESNVAKVLLRGASVMLWSLCLWYLMLQYVALTRP